MGSLDAIDDLGHRYYLQHTLNPYGPPLEGGLPPLAGRLAVLEALSRRLGPQRVVWRYDPVVVTDELTPAWHLARFRELAARLAGQVGRVVVSFVDAYRHQPVKPPSDADRLAAAEGLVEIAGLAGLPISACAEGPDLAALGLGPASCVDASLVEALTGRRPAAGRDRGQRPLCRCHESRDLGAYQSCVHGCLYCYATTNVALARRNHAAHDPLSPTLIGRPAPGAVIVEARPPGAGRRPDQGERRVGAPAP
jgi:hypothetical protein